jgi:hypothetical protein
LQGVGDIGNTRSIKVGWSKFLALLSKDRG